MLGALAESHAMGRLELTVLLDVIADRVLSESARLLHGEDDRLAAATMKILRRDLVGLDVVEPWLTRLAAKAHPDHERPGDPYAVAGNVQPFLRALHLQLALAPRPPAQRADLLLTLIERLRQANPHFLT